MSGLRLGLRLVPLLVAAFVTVLEAKGPTVKLVVTGPGLPNAVEVTSANALAASVWGGEFIGRPSATPPAMLPRYIVAFHVRLPRDQGVKMMYVVQYVRDPFSGRGFVYLPARDDEWGHVNRSTIGRDGQDGRWHSAERKWSEAVAMALPRPKA